MKRENIIEKSLIILSFILLLLVIVYTPTINKYRNNGKLIINEVMPNNKYTIKDTYGLYSDYIEIYNGYDYDINLDGYYLSDDNFNTKKWTFPNVTIKSHDYLLVFATGKESTENELHTNFKLSKKGEVITLSDKNAKSLSKIYYLETLPDTSYGYNGNKYVYYYKGTPNELNKGLTNNDPIEEEKSKERIYINEYITNNLNIVKSKDGNYYPMIELYNDSESDINLEGYFLSNDKKIDKYIFPNIIIKSKEYLIVYTSNKNTIYEGEIHTNFILKDNEKITLYDKYKNEIESLNVNTLPINTSYGKYKNNWVYYSTPTFGLENTDNYLKELNNNQDLIISEVSTDKIEIRNTSNENINLSAYSISLKNNNPIKLGNKSILGKGYYTINTPFTINNNSDTLYLYKDNQIIDILPLGKISSNISRGRTEDGQTVLYKNTTFGSKNSNTYYLGYSLAPEYSINNTYVNKGDTISLSTTDNSKIYYTLDGSDPNKNSTLYKEPIKINETQIIKAIAIKDNYIESTIQSRLYIVGRQHTLPVISLQTNNDNLFSMQSGILVQGYFNNYRQEWYKPINFDYYESDGTLGVTFNGGMKLVGQDSREQPQKSMAIYLKKEYGLKNITYPFFDDDATTIKSFVLRNSGEDPNRIRIKDTFLSEVLKGQMDIDMQKYRAVVVYINGKYYGLYNLREKLNENYIVSNYEIEKGNIDLIKGVDNVQAGTITEYNNLLNYLRNHDTRKEEVYKYLETQIDIDEVINYWIVQTYYRNTDTGNIRYWKEHNGGKWRIMLFDQDWSMYPSTYKTPDLFYPFLPNGHGTGNYFSTLMTYKLYQNETFKDKYLTTFAYHLKNTFNPDRMLSILDNMIKEVESEMPYHIDRWYNEYKTSNMNPIKNMDMWYNNLDKFRTIIKERYSIVLNSIQKEFNLTNSEYEKYFGDLK